MLPLFVIGGPSGVGKSTVLQTLIGTINEVVLLEADILWRKEFNKPDSNYRDFFDVWLRIAKNIAQSGRPVALFGAGFVVPENLSRSVEHRYFSTIHYLGLICSNEALTERLQARPTWRGSADTIEVQVSFNRWPQAPSKHAAD